MATQRSRMAPATKPASHFTGLKGRSVRAERVDDFEDEDGGALSDEAMSSSIESEEGEEEHQGVEDGNEQERSSEPRLSHNKATKARSRRRSSSSDSSNASDPETNDLPGYGDITFGALAAAQQSLLTETGGISTTKGAESRSSNSAGAHSKSSTPYKPPARPPTRSSKHAPQALTSKRPVPRARTIIQPAVVSARDPRFSSLSAGALDSVKQRQNYAFLAAYEDSEMAELKNALAKSDSRGRSGKAKGKAKVEQSEEVKEALRWELGAMRNRRRAEDDKARREQVERTHRRRERELVEQGKKPFFLKGAEVREKALTHKFESMKAKEVRRTLERRAKKKTQRERRAMPHLRRTADG